MIDETVLERLLQEHLEEVKDTLNELDVALGDIASGSVEAAAVFSRLDNSFSVLLEQGRPNAMPLTRKLPFAMLTSRYCGHAALTELPDAAAVIKKGGAFGSDLADALAHFDIT
tara:strand:+ start:296 stop:637 length:342 start_codon:yes stop_codon:yes gene_type:complete